MLLDDLGSPFVIIQAFVVRPRGHGIFFIFILFFLPPSPYCVAIGRGIDTSTLSRFVWELIDPSIFFFVAADRPRSTTLKPGIDASIPTLILLLERQQNPQLIFLVPASQHFSSTHNTHCSNGQWLMGTNMSLGDNLVLCYAVSWVEVVVVRSLRHVFLTRHWSLC